jgi:hypothetical protein
MRGARRRLAITVAAWEFCRQSRLNSLDFETIPGECKSTPLKLRLDQPTTPPLAHQQWRGGSYPY